MYIKLLNRHNSLLNRPLQSSMTWLLLLYLEMRKKQFPDFLPLPPGPSGFTFWVNLKPLILTNTTDKTELGTKTYDRIFH